MHIIPTSGKERWRLFLFLLKICTALVPLFFFPLINGLGLGSGMAEQLIVLGCFLSFIIFLASAVRASGESRKGARSSFIFAVVALFWIFIIAILIPSLAKSK